MHCLEIVHAVRLAWLTTPHPVFDVLDPDFDGGSQFLALLKPTLPDGRKSTARLRYFAVTEQTQLNLPPFFAAQCLAPGLHFNCLPALNVELHLWVGCLRTGLQEFKMRFDAVLHSDAQHKFVRRLETSRVNLPLMPNSPRSAAVVGAGIAGSSVALALCKQGVKVHLYDSASGAAKGASGNWVGAFHPHITRGDSPLSRLSRLGFEHTVHALETLSNCGLLEKDVDWALPGHLQTVPNEEAQRTQETLKNLDFPDELVRWIEPNELLPTPLGGLYFPKGGWVKPARWVQANLQACGNLLTTHYNSAVNTLDELRLQHDVVVVCCAEQSIQLAPILGARVGVVKGQISRLRKMVQPSVVLSGESYAIAPSCESWMVLGATYERPVLDLEPTARADEENMARFKSAFPQWPLGELLDHRCAVRAVWHDRLPAIGPVPNTSGVYMSTGFASRGLLWAALGAWAVASHSLGQPCSLRLLDKITPRGVKV